MDTAVIRLDEFFRGSTKNYPPKHGDFFRRHSLGHASGSFQPWPGLTLQWEKFRRGYTLSGLVVILETATGKPIAALRRKRRSKIMHLDLAGKVNYLTKVVEATPNLAMLLN